MKRIDELFAKFPVLEVNDTIILRRFSRKDAQDYLEFYSIPEVNKFIPDSMIPKNLEEAELEVKNIIDSFNSKQDFYWAIADKETTN